MRYILFAALLSGVLTAAQSDELVEAVRFDDRSSVAALLKAGADPGAHDPDGATALSWAVVRGNLGTATQLLQAGADPDRANELGIGPLALAVENGSVEMVELLLEHGASPGPPRQSGETPLMTAARLGRTDVMRILLDKGADPDSREKNFGQTALMWAAGRPAAVRLLLARGADPLITTRVWDVEFTIYAPATFTLGKTGIPWNTSGAYHAKRGGQNALFFAVQERDVESARALIDAGVDVNATSADGSSPLLAALYKWVPPDADFVPGKGAPAQSGSSQKFGPDLAMARLLLARGAAATAQDSAGYTPLHGAALAVAWAARRDDKGGSGAYRRAPALLSLNPPKSEPSSFTVSEALDVVHLLLDAGADPDHQTRYPTPGPPGDVRINPAPTGSSPLHIAANAGSPELVDMLAAAGADPNLIRNDGHSPFSVAVVAGDIAVVKRMVAHHADLSARYDPDDKIPDPEEAVTVSRQGQTILHIAAANLVHEIVEYLGSAGAALTEENAHGETPLDLADHQERFREALDRQRAEGNAKRLAEVVRDTRTSDTIKKLLEGRT